MAAVDGTVLVRGENTGGWLMTNTHPPRRQLLREMPGQLSSGVPTEDAPTAVTTLSLWKRQVAGVREICDRYGIVFIADEVMAGFGRTGKWFAINHFDVVPDLITFAKGVTSGYVPLGGVAISDAIAKTFADRPYPGGLTYSGHPLATACAVATITAMEDEQMIVNAARIGEHVLGPGLRELALRHRSVGEVRGLGVFWALELVGNPDTREPLAPYGGTSPAMNAVLAACKANGLLPFANFNRIHVVPPCNVTDTEVSEGLRILDAALAVADSYVE